MCQCLLSLLCFVAVTLQHGDCSTQSGPDEVALFQIKSGEKWGFINRRGRVVVPPEFDMVNGSAADAVCAHRRNGWVELQIDEDAVTTTPIDCDPSALMVRRLGKGMFGVVEENGNTSLYDPMGKFQVEYDHDTHVQPFREDLLPLKIGGSYGFVDRRGRIAIQPRYDMVGGFHEGLDTVRLLNKKWGCIDHSGRVVVPARFEAPVIFSEGVAMVFDGEACRFINRNGIPAFDGKFRFAGSFSGGLAWAVDFQRDAPRRYGYIDQRGNYAISPKYEVADDFNDGLAAVTFTRQRRQTVADKVMGYIDAVIGSGRLGVQREATTEKVTGYIDRKGDLVIHIEDARKLYDFNKGLALVRTDEWMGYIDRTGKCVWKTDEPWTPSLSQQEKM